MRRGVKKGERWRASERGCLVAGVRELEEWRACGGEINRN